jgi:hypothetical protein
MRGKDFIKKHKKVPSFLRARTDYERIKLLKIFDILQTEERRGKKRGEINWLYLSKER